MEVLVFSISAMAVAPCAARLLPWKFMSVTVLFRLSTSARASTSAPLSHHAPTLKSSFVSEGWFAPALTISSLKGREADGSTTILFFRPSSLAFSRCALSASVQAYI
jgi:hypothetical protein